MIIVEERPPNWSQILLAFPLVLQRKPIFAYGAVLYNPHGLTIPPALVAHEEAHSARMPDPALWWHRYCGDRIFRLEEEIIAHVAELQWWLENGTRPERRRAAKMVADKFRDPIYRYGPLVTTDLARRLLSSADVAGALELARRSL